MTFKKILIRTAAVLIALTVLGSCFVFAASYGTQEDPLVTLSYITNVFLPQIIGQVDAKISAGEEAYRQKLDSQISVFRVEIDTKIQTLRSEEVKYGTSDTYSVVTLNAGQTLTGSVGTELLLRIGSASCTASSATGLIDSTDGGVLENGQQMVKNHLYMVTIDGRGMKAGGGTVMVLVRGKYSVS